MDKLTEILIKKRKEQEKYFKNYLFWAREIKKEAQKFLGPVKLFVFGSILRQSKTEIPRDIDILIISPRLKTSMVKSKIRIKIWKKFGTNTPFEIHLISPEDFIDWYDLFIKEKVEIS